MLKLLSFACFIVNTVYVIQHEYALSSPIESKTIYILNSIPIGLDLLAVITYLPKNTLDVDGNVIKESLLTNVIFFIKYLPLLILSNIDKILAIIYASQVEDNTQSEKNTLPLGISVIVCGLILSLLYIYVMFDDIYVIK